MNRSEIEFHTSLQAALSKLPVPDGKRFADVFKRGDLSVEIYAPRGVDPQEPHRRDEIYLVARGTGIYLCVETRRGFGPGDFLFAPAGAVHRFEDFSDDLAVWVIFFGPEGDTRQKDEFLPPKKSGCFGQPDWFSFV